MSDADIIEGSGAEQTPAIACAGLVRRFGDLTAVDGVDLSVRQGECFGLLGPNGAGKTTTVELLEGLNRPDAGTVALFGTAWGEGQDRQLRARLGVALQETRLPEKLTVEETLRVFRSFYPTGQAIETVMADLGLMEKRRARVGKLSGGQAQRLALGCALVGNPELLFLDEPTTGLDPQARLVIWDWIERFQRDGGTVLLTTHYMEEAARLCDRVAIMDAGKIIALDTPAGLIASLSAEHIVELTLSEPVARERLLAVPGVETVELREDEAILSIHDVGATLPAIIARLSETGVTLTRLATHEPTLEDVFVHLTGKALRDG